MGWSQRLFSAPQRLDLGVTQPGTYLLQGLERMFNLGKWQGPLPWCGIVQEFCSPRDLISARATPDNAANDLTVQQEIVAAGSQLDKTIGHLFAVSLSALNPGHLLW
jgi:hypothetical protein